MHGNDIVRFCDHCAKHVNNFSAITEKEALRLVRKSKGNICIRYIQDPQTARPLFSQQLTPITRRKPLMAAGVMSASLSLSALAFAQGGSPLVDPSLTVPVVNEQSRPDKENRSEKPGESGSAGNLYGTVTDPNGGLIPNARVVLLDGNNSELQTAETDENGGYKIENVPSGTFTLAISAPGFTPARIEQVTVDGLKTLDATLQVGAVSSVGGMIVVAREYKQPLAKAVEQNDIDEVKNLIARGEDVNGKEEDKTTPLFIAVEKGNLEIAKLLIDFGAKVNARNEEKQTPLMMLSDETSKELVELLLDNGAKVNLTAKDGNTALIVAAQTAKPEVLQALIDAGAEINAKNEDGQTALINAAYADDLEKVRMLLNAGAEVNAQNNDGETAYDETDVDEIEQLLVSFGAVIKEKPKYSSDAPPSEE
jgi:hypothetical protein